ncbi:MAG: 50S ribosomal protein L4 [Candidatus Moraniibacteriota bacterium]|nr:MAG: 50S ribosomal protein L4 [Candidatus Moranbacteria bacterium]
MSMSSIAVKNLEGKVVEEVTLDKSLFDLPKNDALLHQVYVVLSGNLRTAVAHTKDRAERAGSGKKPWKQKGTGRARHGSVRSPIWRKGGVTFGPTKDRNFVREISRKMRQKAVLIALSEKIRLGKLVVVDTLVLPEKKTKVFATALKALAITPRRVAVSLLGDENQTAMVMRNIPKLSVVHHPDLNVKDLLDNEFILMTKTALLDLDRRFHDWKK